jgi:hypothetical protein
MTAMMKLVGRGVVTPVLNKMPHHEDIEGVEV